MNGDLAVTNTPEIHVSSVQLVAIPINPLPFFSPIKWNISLISNVPIIQAHSQSVK